MYANTGGHSQQTNSSDGSIVVLDDGSIWIVSPAERSLTSVWIDATSITVNHGSGLAYELVDTGDQEVVEAGYIGQE